MLNAALAYARCGWSVFPLPPGRKLPIIDWKRWQSERASEAQIRRWWMDCPNANIAIATGEVSGVFVLDFDFHFPVGEHTTYTVDSGSGGTHYYYNMPDFPVRNHVDLVPNVDIRGTGGYIVAAPSLHPEGGRYRVRSRLAVADAPNFLLRLLKAKIERPSAKPKQNPLPPSAGASYWARVVMNRELDTLAGTAKGERGVSGRNDQLNRSAYNLGQLVGDELLSSHEVESALYQVAMQIGLGERESEKTIASGLTAGIANPRSKRARVKTW